MSEIFDVKFIEDEMRKILKSYSGIPQLIIGEQSNIPEDDLSYPRILLKARVPSAELGVEAKTRALIPSSEDEFESDMEVTHHSFPRMTINLDGFADPKREVIYDYFQKLENWFDTASLGQRWFDRNLPYDIVIREVNEPNDVTAEFQKEFEQRMNMDIVLELKKEVVIVEKTIEELDLNENYN